MDGVVIDDYYFCGDSFLFLISWNGIGKTYMIRLRFDRDAAEYHNRNEQRNERVKDSFHNHRVFIKNNEIMVFLQGYQGGLFR